MHIPFGWSAVIKSAVRVNSHLFHFLIVPIRSRSHSGFQLKQADKICLARETHHLTNSIGREVCIRKQILSLCDAEGIQVVIWGKSGVLLKRAKKMILAESTPGCHILQTDFMGIVLSQIFRQRCNRWRNLPDQIAAVLIIQDK